MLVNVCRKQLTDIFAQFKPMEPKEPVSNESSKVTSSCRQVFSSTNSTMLEDENLRTSPPTRNDLGRANVDCNSWVDMMIYKISHLMM